MDPHKGASQCAHAERCQIPVRSKPVSLSETILVKWGSVFKFSSLSLSDQLGLWSYCHHPQLLCEFLQAAPSLKTMLRETWPSVQTASRRTFSSGVAWILCNHFFLHFLDGWDQGSVCLHVQITGLKALPPRNILSNLSLSHKTPKTFWEVRIRKALESRLQPSPCGHDGLYPNFLTSAGLPCLQLA